MLCPHCKKEIKDRKNDFETTGIFIQNFIPFGGLVFFIIMVSGGFITRHPIAEKTFMGIIFFVTIFYGIYSFLYAHGKVKGRFLIYNWIKR